MHTNYGSFVKLPTVPTIYDKKMEYLALKKAIVQAWALGKIGSACRRENVDGSKWEPKRR